LLGLFELLLRFRHLLLEVFQLTLKITVGDSENSQLVGELLVSSHEELLQGVFFRLGRAVSSGVVLLSGVAPFIVITG
jgi:hypothetical protein